MAANPRFDWARFVGETALPVLKQTIFALPQALEADRLIEQNQIKNEQLHDGIQEMAQKLGADPRIRKQFAERFNVNENDVSNHILKMFRPPNKNESTKEYTNNLGEGMQRLALEGFGGPENIEEASVLGSFMQAAPSGVVSKDLYQQHNALVNKDRNKEFQQKLLEGVKDERGDVVYRSPEEVAKMRLDYGMGPEDKFDAEDVNLGKYNQQKVQDVLQRVNQVEVQNNVEIDTLSKKEAAALMRSNGFNINDINFFLQLRSNRPSTMDQLKLSGEMLNQAKTKAQIKKIEQEIVESSGKLKQEQLEKITVPVEDLQSQADKYHSLAEDQQRAAIAAKDNKQSDLRMTAERKQREFELLSFGFQTAADSARANEGALPQKQVPKIRQQAELKARATDVWDDFQGSDRKTVDVLQQIAEQEGFVLGDVDENFAHMTYRKGGKPVKLSLKDGTIEFAEPTFVPEPTQTTIQTKKVPSTTQEMSVPGDIIASANNIFADLTKTQDTEKTYANIGIAASMNGFALITPEDRFNPDGVVILQNKNGDIVKLDLSTGSSEQVGEQSSDTQTGGAVDFGAILRGRKK